jgi:hypothetical protein
MGKAIEKSHGSGPKIPWLIALAILERAHPYFKEKRGIGFGKLTLMFQKGECKIMSVETTPPNSYTFRVQVAGSGTTICLKDLLDEGKQDGKHDRPQSPPLYKS